MEFSEAIDVSYEIVLEANAINIPKNSKKVYELVYNKFSKWKTQRNSGK